MSNGKIYYVISKPYRWRARRFDWRQHLRCGYWTFACWSELQAIGVYAARHTTSPLTVSPESFVSGRMTDVEANDCTARGYCCFAIPRWYWHSRWQAAAAVSHGEIDVRGSDFKFDFLPRFVVNFIGRRYISGRPKRNAMRCTSNSPSFSSNSPAEKQLKLEA